MERISDRLVGRNGREGFGELAEAREEGESVSVWKEKLTFVENAESFDEISEAVSMGNSTHS